MKDCPIEVRAFREREAAAEWLGVPLEMLRADSERATDSEA
jgi:hypothetical protein